MGKKFVIFKHFNTYKITSKYNWDEGIMNLNAVTTITNVSNYEEAKKAVLNWLKIDEEQIVNETGE